MSCLALELDVVKRADVFPEWNELIVNVEGRCSTGYYREQGETMALTKSMWPCRSEEMAIEVVQALRKEVSLFHVPNGFAYQHEKSARCRASRSVKQSRKRSINCIVLNTSSGSAPRLTMLASLFPGSFSTPGASNREITVNRKHLCANRA